ncbi:hypothetical protein HRW07_10655 [Streptomyces lunaelactis]|uniref:hypothetical protein n=1 Tax=Streptomyces lunaelactis TaxID=1535768 RepID=UPI001584E8F5|nr:hypothetical protein [Streptomyces lunaelactis]NUL03686.1 hypothetical protein [Streptomyces lunaelactis]
MARSLHPDDLLAAQREWNRTYVAMASQLGSTTVLRRRLLRLSGRVFWHPFWSSAAGRGPAARVELRRRVRVQEREEVSAR